MIDRVKFKGRLTLLTDAEISLIHQASLKILSTTGMAMALADHRYDHLEKAGARVDRAKHRVYFPVPLVEKAVKTSPPTFTLGARNPENRLHLDKKNGYLAMT